NMRSRRPVDIKGCGNQNQPDKRRPPEQPRKPPHGIGLSQLPVPGDVRNPHFHSLAKELFTFRNRGEIENTTINTFPFLPGLWRQAFLGSETLPFLVDDDLKISRQALLHRLDHSATIAAG